MPQVFDENRAQHVVLTYDGAMTRLYLDGQPRAETDGMKGGFGNWGHDHALTFGDEPPGGDAWSGLVWRVSIHDRALGGEEVQRLYRGEAVPKPLLRHDFAADEGKLPDGLKKLRYRNLFLTTDPSSYQLGDCLFNVLGFVPLGVMVYLLLPVRLERRKILAVILVPLLVGLAASGTIEWLQSYVFRRVPCLLDLIYNSTGTLLGGLLAWLVFSTFNRREK